MDSSGNMLLELIDDTVVDPEGLVVFRATIRGDSFALECGDHAGTCRIVPTSVEADHTMHCAIIWEGHHYGERIEIDGATRLELIHPMPELWVLALLISIGHWRYG